MIGLEDDCLLALVNDNNKVIGSVSFSEYKKNPKKYKILTLRVIVVSEENEFILSPGSFFNESAYDTAYCTILKYKEDYETALKRISDALPSAEIRFLTQYISKNDKYDVKVCLLYAQLDKENVKSSQERVILYPSEIGTDDIIGNEILFGEIDFLKTNVIPYLNLDIYGNIE